MNKKIALILSFLLLVSITGCAKKIELNSSEVLSDIQNIMKEEMIAEGMPADRFTDENIPGYMSSNIIDTENPNMYQDYFNLDLIQEGYVFQHMMNVKSDLIIFIKATDESNIDTLKESLDQVHQQQDQIWSQYLPDQYEKVKKSEIIIKDQYILYVTSDYQTPIIDLFNKYFE